MYAGMNAPDLAQSEEDVFSYNFVNDLYPDEQLVDSPPPQVTIKPLPKTADPNFAARITSSASISTDIERPEDTRNIVCSKRVLGAVPGVRYKITWAVTTSTNRKLTRHSFYNGVDDA